MSYTGIREWPGECVEGAPESFEYRPGFRLTDSPTAAVLLTRELDEPRPAHRGGGGKAAS